jgi:hypothetical protein
LGLKNIHPFCILLKENGHCISRRSCICYSICREKLREKESQEAAVSAATLAAEADIQRKMAERRRLMEEVDRKRRDRKRAEEERWAAEQRRLAAQKAEEEERSELERRRAAEAARIKERIERPPGDRTPASGKEKLKDSEDAATPKSEGKFFRIIYFVIFLKKYFIHSLDCIFILFISVVLWIGVTGSSSVFSVLASSSC